MGLSILLRTAQGDAYGAGFEYGSVKHVADNNTLTRFVKNEKHDLKPAHYTDDAQMSVANAEVILSGKAITREALARGQTVVYETSDQTQPNLLDKVEPEVLQGVAGPYCCIQAD